MTAVTMPARPEADASLRPVPWRRMAWVTWRQHRLALGGVAALLGGLAVWLWIAGLRLHHAYAAATACHPASSPACADLIETFNGMNQVLSKGYVLQAVPALIGAFVGAPVLARELETGTFRYVWTQGFGRCRWTLAKLVPLAVAVTAAGALSVLFTWYYQPYFSAGNQALGLDEASPLTPGLFDLRGIAFAAWTLTAFAIGALAGMLIRRVVPAIVATLAAYTGLAIVAGNVLRQHYLTPLVIRNLFNPPGSDWVITQWWTKGGKFAYAGVRPPIDLVEQYCPPSAVGVVGSGKPSPGTLWQCFSQHGYTLWTRYQPASRFWPFQWIESGWLLALSVLLIVATVWLVRRRAA
jgi:ABC-2 family transporter